MIVEEGVPKIDDIPEHRLNISAASSLSPTSRRRGIVIGDEAGDDEDDDEDDD